MPDQLFDRRILRKEAVPVDTSIRNGDSTIELRNCCRSQNAFDAEALSVKHLEVAAEHLHGADANDRRARTAGKLPKFLEIEVLQEHVAEALLAPGRELVGTYLRHTHHVP